MSESFELLEPDLFTTGAVGPKGSRVFYLQARQSGHVISLKVEKQQVNALADYLERVLQDLPPSPPSLGVSNLSLAEPVEASWIVGGIGVAWDERVGRVVLVAEELTTDDDEDEPATARLMISPEQIRAFVEHARVVVAAGREPCPYCGAPLDPAAGGFCPCSN